MCKGKNRKNQQQIILSQREMDFLNRLLYTAVGAFSIFYFFVKLRLSHWKKRGILHEKPTFLWGNLKGVGSKRHITIALNEIYERYKGKAPFIGFYAWLRPLILVLDVELAQRILNTDAAYFRERGLYNNIEEEPLSENLIQLDGCAYENLHYTTASYFKRVETLVPTLVSVANTFRRSVSVEQSKSEIMNVKNLAAAYSTDVISLLAFGLEGDALNFPHTEFRAMTRAYMNKMSLFKLYLAWSFPNVARIFGFKLYNEAASAYFIELVRNKLEERSSPYSAKLKFMDFLQLFIENQHNFRIGERCLARIAAQCFTFLLASLEASTSTLSFCLYELALHMNIQEKAREEILNVLNKHKHKITAESLSEMIYLKQILYETLRKHSPYPFLLRNTLKDYEIPDSVFMLQTGNSIIIPISSIHHDPQIYTNPQKFDPSRFNADNVAKRNPAAFLPFGAGPRSCLTREFAEIQMLVCLVTLLQQYKFSPCPETNILIQYDQKKLIATPKHEVRLRVERL